MSFGSCGVIGLLIFIRKLFCKMMADGRTHEQMSHVGCMPAKRSSKTTDTLLNNQTLVRHVKIHEKVTLVTSPFSFKPFSFKFLKLSLCYLVFSMFFFTKAIKHMEDLAFSLAKTGPGGCAIWAGLLVFFGFRVPGEGRRSYFWDQNQ